MGYRAENDPYCYPGTTILVNKSDIRDRDLLATFETSMFAERAEGTWPSGSLDKRHYLSLHRHLFQDVYAWAGKPRTVRTGKGGNWFCFPDFIDGELDRLFGELTTKHHLKGLDLDDFAREAAHFLGEINAVHAFREGNGRTQLAFLRLLCLNAGFAFNASALERERVISAMIDSFDRRLEALTALIRDLAANPGGEN